MQTENLELKKLVDLDLINQSKSQPDLAILAINTFVKDSQDPNPLVRDLAVRTMGCIRVDKITEYLCDPFQHCLKDDDPYVRKTTTIYVAKLYDINAELVEDKAFLDALNDLISSNNPMVTANVVAALAEIQENSSRSIFEIKSHTLSELLTALNEYTEFRFQTRKHILFDDSKKLNPTLLDKLLPNIYTLSSVYHKPSEAFIIRVMTTQKIEDEKYTDVGEQGYYDSPAPIEENGVSPPASTSNVQHLAARQPSAPTFPALFLLDLSIDNSNNAIVSVYQDTTSIDPSLPIVLPASNGQGFQISA
ncbi:AP-1 complex subunit beta-1 [Capsicum chinense]|nr:AP-1 complex subunit beta-1 [Capsicum chinense]